MKRILNNYRLIGLDTNIFIYFFDRRSLLHLKSVNFFKAISEKQLAMVTSTITVAELLCLDADHEILAKLGEELFSIPDMVFVEVDKIVAKEAALIRRKYKFLLPDSIQLATALYAKADAFVTNDKKLKGCKEIRVIILDEY